MDWWNVRMWCVVCCFSRCYGCNACSYPPETQTTSQAKAQAIHYCQKSCKPPQILPNPLKNPSRNPSQTFPNRKKIELQPRKRRNCIKNCLPSMIGKLLGRVLDAQSLPREAQEPPKSCQNLAPNAKKSMAKNKSFPDSIFSWFVHGFGWFFASFLEAKTLPNC